MQVSIAGSLATQSKSWNTVPSFNGILMSMYSGCPALMCVTRLLHIFCFFAFPFFCRYYLDISAVVDIFRYYHYQGDPGHLVRSSSYWFKDRNCWICLWAD